MLAGKADCLVKGKPLVPEDRRAYALLHARVPYGIYGGKAVSHAEDRTDPFAIPTTEPTVAPLQSVSKPICTALQIESE